jgi:thiamine-phosphate pyrophosphorylase
MRSGPILCYITDRNQFESFATFFDFLQVAARARLDLLQIREKDLDGRVLASLTSAALDAATGSDLRIVVNDRLDVAMAVGAAGVHLGTRSLPVAVARKIAPPGFLIGASCHSLAEAEQAQAGGADYILLGPIFETPSKMAFGPPLGLATLQAVATRVKLPVVALGGITVPRIQHCLEAGAAGIAGIRIFQECGSIERRVDEIRAALTGNSGFGVGGRKQEPA